MASDLIADGDKLGGSSCEDRVKDLAENDVAVESI